MHNSFDLAEKVWLYDTTLRDGAQREGISLSVDDKIKIAGHLDNLGIHFIEVGWPGANPKDAQVFESLKQIPFRTAQLVPFCSTRRSGHLAHQEPLFQPILAADTQWVTLFGKSWDLHVKEALKTSLGENLAMISDSVRYLKQQGRRIIYDAEHWFDGFLDNSDYALSTLHAAIAAGAEWLVLCDTNGGTLPSEISEITQGVINALSGDTGIQCSTVQIGIHAHNDGGMAVANSISAVQAGAQMVQGTMNGYGERCGNANLCSVIPNLQLKLNRPCLEAHQLRNLTATSRIVSEIVNLAPDEHAPFVGQSAFAHKGGIHVSAVQRNPRTYEHISPEKVGNHQRIVISEQSGLSNILEKAHHYGFPLKKNDPVGRQILTQIKALEQEGYQFEAAEASFELLVRRHFSQRPEYFKVMGFDVYCRRSEPCDPSAPQTHSIATIKLTVNGEEILTAAEGLGPVEALDLSLRKALTNSYPTMGEFQLTDYKVRILDSEAGTSAKTRVLIEFSDGKQRWTTLGVSDNIIQASYQALTEGIEYGLMLKHQCYLFERQS